MREATAIWRAIDDALGKVSYSTAPVFSRKFFYDHSPEKYDSKNTPYISTWPTGMLLVSDGTRFGEFRDYVISIRIHAVLESHDSDGNEDVTGTELMFDTVDEVLDVFSVSQQDQGKLTIYLGESEQQEVERVAPPQVTEVDAEALQANIFSMDIAVTYRYHSQEEDIID